MSNDRMTEVKSVQQEPEREQRIFSFKASQLIWLFLGILEGLIALRIGLKLIAANPDSPIVSLIYGLTYLFLFPFEGMTATPAVGGMVLELSSYFAMVIYALIAWAVDRIVWVLFYRPRAACARGKHHSNNDQRAPYQSMSLGCEKWTVPFVNKGPLRSKIRRAFLRASGPLPGSSSGWQVALN